MGVDLKFKVYDGYLMGVIRMSNTSKGASEHDYGSKHWIQEIVNNEDLCRQLNRAISGMEKLRWISPVNYEDYAEYKLNQQIMLDNLGITDREIARELFKFWPTQQPQWDGIAVSNDNNAFYLIEAKAHVEEVVTRMPVSKPGASAKSIENHQLILDSMGAVFKKIADGGNFESWKYPYYQLGNRLTFLYYLNSSPFLKDKRFHLVLLDFVNDKHFQNTLPMWEDAYKKIWKEMLGNAPVPDTVQVINWDVSNLENAALNLNAIHHVAIIVSDYEISKDFYVNKLGFQVIRENYRPERNDWKLDLACGGIELEIFAEPNPPARASGPEACGLRHLAFHVASVDETVEQLKTRGIECEPIRVDEFTGKHMTFFKDPDGLPLELHE